MDSNPIFTRIRKLGVSTNSVEEMIRETYFKETIDLALSAATNSADKEWIKKIDALILALDGGTIRNAVCHPNRLMPDYYWYRCAAIASDPSVDALDLREVKEAFHNASNNKLTSVPEEWYQQPRWSIRTNLPVKHEHSITGLIGRKKEQIELAKALESAHPLISVQGIGGIGKTSLVLQVLGDLCLQDSKPAFDGVIWSSMKQEKLTEQGLIPLDAPLSILDLESELVASINDVFCVNFSCLEDAKSEFKTKKLLLCLDNLDVLLCDNSTVFDDFQSQLPDSWKLLVTSRVTVESAKPVKLRSLDLSGAIDLVRKYLSSLGADIADTKVFERIATACKMNPLAIRLTIDYYRTGVELDSALAKSGQEVLEFSFKNILSTLSEVDRNILEILFALEKVGRNSICGILNAQAEEVQDAFSRLQSMTLVDFIEGERGKEYLLQPSVIDLIRTFPVNVAIRKTAIDWVASRKSSAEHHFKVQNEKGTSRISLTYIPHDADFRCIDYFRRISLGIKKKTSLAQLSAEIQRQIEVEPSNYLLHQLLATSYLIEKTYMPAEREFRRALAINQDNASAKYGLLLTYENLRNNAEICELSRELISEGWGDPELATDQIANRIWNVYLRTLNFQQKLKQVLDATEDWRQSKYDLPSLALNRSSAFRRLAAKENEEGILDDSRLGQLLAYQAEIFTVLLRFDKVPNWIFPELRKALNEIPYYLKGNHFFHQMKGHDQKKISKLACICKLRKEELVQHQIPVDAIDDLLQFVYTDHYELRQRELIAQGYVIGLIKMRPAGGVSKYFFAVDESGQQYHVPLDKVKSDKRNLAASIQIGNQVALKPIGCGKFNSSASEAILID